MISGFEYQPRTRTVFGTNSFHRLGKLARELDFHRALLVADPGIRAQGFVDQAVGFLQEQGVRVFPFHEFGENPDSQMVEQGSDWARSLGIDSLIGLGGGSSMDCAKGINFLLSNGGGIRDYWGYGKAQHPMFPMIGIPTTAGTGSEVQSYALISDEKTHAKMACGDPQASFRVVILDFLLTVTQPKQVTAAAGYDALAHAVETSVSTKQNPISRMFTLEAWRLLEGNLARVLEDGADLEARAAMQLGAHFAGMAIENSMLGATHACANPLTAQYGMTHGVAIALLLPSVVRWNGAAAGDQYAELLKMSSPSARRGDGVEGFAVLLENLARVAGFPRKLRELGVSSMGLSRLAEEAAKQWTGRFNPRTFDAQGALEIYQAAY
ncbi:MAG: iron-containing alcohol dehydrogenase [Terriglobia bacterium]